MKHTLLVHDLRRTAVRNMLEAGISQHDIMQICGWLTDSLFRRYALRDPARLQREMGKLGEHREREQQGRADVIKQEQALASLGKHKVRIRYDPKKPAQRAMSTRSPLAPATVT